VTETRLRAVEHHGAVGSYGGQSAHPITRFRTESAESINQLSVIPFSTMRAFTVRLRTLERNVFARGAHGVDPEASQRSAERSSFR